MEPLCWKLVMLAISRLLNIHVSLSPVIPPDPAPDNLTVEQARLGLCPELESEDASRTFAPLNIPLLALPFESSNGHLVSLVNG